MSSLALQALIGPVVSLEVLNRFLEIALKGTTVYVAAWLLSRLARQQAAAVRARIWAIALWGLLAVVILSFTPAVVRVALLPHSPGFGLDPRSAPLEALVARSGSAPTVQESAEQARAIGRMASATRVGSVLLLAWSAGVVWCLARWAASQRSVSRRAARAEAPAASVQAALTVSLERFGMHRPVQIRQSPGLALAWTWGLFRPVIVLPREADRWPASSLELVLSHELAHIRRRDCWTECLARVVAALLWWHPAAWASLKNLRREREVACDDAVLEHGAKPSD